MFELDVWTGSVFVPITVFVAVGFIGYFGEKEQDELDDVFCFEGTLAKPFKSNNALFLSLYMAAFTYPWVTLIYRRLVWEFLAEHRGLRKVATVIAVCIYALMSSMPLVQEWTAANGEESHWFLLLVLDCLGFFFMASITQIGELARIVYDELQRRRKRPPVSAARFGAIMWAVVLLNWALHVKLGHDPVVVKETTLELPAWPPCLDGYRIALLSDLHIGPYVGKQDVEAVVELANRQDAQLTLLAGDIVDGPPELRAPAVRPLANLTAEDGVYYVTGNHDYMHGSSGEDWASWFRENTSITPMINERQTLPLAGYPNCKVNEQAQFQLLGVPDFTANPALGKLMEDAGKGPYVLFAHQPNQWRVARDLGVDLQLSGHTHAGHWFPFNLFLYLVNAALSGVTWWPQGNSMLYVTDGVFGWGPRMRLFCHNAISVLTIRHAPAGRPPNLPDETTSTVAAVILWLLFLSLVFAVVVLRAPHIGIVWAAGLGCVSFSLFVWRRQWVPVFERFVTLW